MMRTYVPERTFMKLVLGNDPADKVLSLFLEPLNNKNIITSIINKMENEFRNVLVGQKSVLKKTHTFIQNFPDGKEKGIFLGVHFDYGVIDIAGIKLDGVKTLASTYESVIVPEEERLLRGTERVMFVAKSLKYFSRRLRVVEYPDVSPIWCLGVNYGYLKEEGRFGLSSLHTKSWPDEYNFTGKPVRMRNLNKKIVSAADSIGFNLDIKGFLHTPEAVYLDSIWKYPNTIGALSLNHRCVSCFREETNKVSKILYKNDDLPYILLKIYWEQFGNEGELDALLNDFDKELEHQSGETRRHVFRYIVNEKYIVKLVRLVLIALSEKGIIFKSNSANKENLKDYMQEETHAISTMARSYCRGMGDQIERTYRVDSLQVDDINVINKVVQVISWRASILLGIIICVYARYASKAATESIFLINGNYSEKEIEDIKLAVEYIMDIDDSMKGKKVTVQYSTHSHVFGAAILAAIYTKDPFVYDSDYQD